MNLNTFISKLPRYSHGAFATTTNNKTHIRGWQFQFSKDNKFYFATTKEKNAYKQLIENPYGSFFAVADNQCFDITGEVKFITDKTQKEEVLSNLDPTLQKMIPNADAFECFVIEKGAVRYSESIGKPFEVIEF